MYKKTVTINNQNGLTVRPANIFVKRASEFSSSVNVKHNGILVNGKSYLGLLSRSIKCGDEIEISANGPDEIAAVDALVTVVESNFTDYWYQKVPKGYNLQALFYC